MAEDDPRQSTRFPRPLTRWPTPPELLTDQSRKGASASQTNDARSSRTRRVLAYYAHAIITFHTYGIPLSSGLHLEYYFNTLFPTQPLEYLSLIVGIQYVGLFGMDELAAYAYKWKHWYWTIIGAATAFLFSQAAMLGAKPWWGLFLSRMLSGICLGYLRSLSLRCLASHYRNDVAFVSKQSGAASMAGGLVHSLVAWAMLREGKFHGLLKVNIGMTVPTLFLALACMSRASGSDAEAPKRVGKLTLRHRQSSSQIPLQWERQGPKGHPTLADSFLVSGYLIVFFSVFVWPTFFPLLVCSQPMYKFPEYASRWMFGMFTAAIPTAIWFAHERPNLGIGVVNTFTASAIFAGFLVLTASIVQNAWVWGFIGVLYGLCLGPIVALHKKVLDIMLRDRDGWAERTLTSVAMGIAAFGGISFAGVLIPLTGSPLAALLVSGVVMILGGVCISVGRWLKYPARYVVV